MTLANLRSPAFLPDFLFETHWTYWIAAIILGALCIFLARRAADGRLLRAGQIILAIALAWILAAQLFDTPGERLYNAHLALANAAKAGDADKILAYLDKDFSSEALELNRNTFSRDEIAAQLKSYGIEEITITHYAAVLKNATALSNITVFTKLSMGPFLSRWQLSWNDIPGEDWKVVLAVPLDASGHPLSGISK